MLFIGSCSAKESSKRSREEEAGREGGLVREQRLHSLPAAMYPRTLIACPVSLRALPIVCFTLPSMVGRFYDKPPPHSRTQPGRAPRSSETRPPLSLQLDPSPDQLPTNQLDPSTQTDKGLFKTKISIRNRHPFLQTVREKSFWASTLSPGGWIQKHRTGGPPGQTDLPSSVTLKISDAAKVSFVVL